MIDLSVIVISSHPKELIRVIDMFKKQTFAGFTVELIVVQCLVNDNHHEFMTIQYPLHTKIRRIIPPHNNYYDNAAAARDYGFRESCGQYVVFWDDDNIYEPYYLTTMYSAVYGHDIAVAKVNYLEHVIGDEVAPGRIDTMCVCVSRSVAAQVNWYDGGGGYNDYRWAKRCLSLSNNINYIPVIVGRHL